MGIQTHFIQLNNYSPCWCKTWICSKFLTGQHKCPNSSQNIPTITPTAFVSFHRWTSQAIMWVPKRLTKFCITETMFNPYHIFENVKLDFIYEKCWNIIFCSPDKLFVCLFIPFLFVCANLWLWYETMQTMKNSSSFH